MRAPLERLLPILVPALMIAAAGPARAQNVLWLEVIVNGQPTGKVVQFTQRHDALYARPADLKKLGLRLPPHLTSGHNPWLALRALPGLSARLANRTQTLYLTAADRALRPRRLRATVPVGPTLPVESGTGATLNYDILAVSNAGHRYGSGQFELRAFSPAGVLSTHWLSHVGTRRPGQASTLRLDTTYAHADPDTLLRWRVGDVIASGPGWSRAIRMGGIQIASDFSIRPDLLTFPLPSLVGSVTMPSTVDVLVNGTQLFSRQIGAGPFEVPSIPVVTGAGRVSMTVTDALGRQVTTTLPFYASPDLLAPGLHSFSLQAGWVRQRWGLVSNDYGAWAASGSWRSGLSSRLTVQTHAEATRGLAMAGGGTSLALGQFAVLNLAMAGSRGSGRRGGELALGVRHKGRRFSMGLSAMLASTGFRDIAAMNGNPVPHLRLNAYAGLSLLDRGSLGIAFTALERPPIRVEGDSIVPPGSGTPTFPYAAAPSFLLPQSRVRMLTASYSRSFRTLTLRVSGFHDFGDTSNSGLMLGITVPLGTRRSASLSVASKDGGGYTQVQANQSATSVGDWGYQFYGVQDGHLSHQFAQVQYKSHWALLTAGADHIAGQNTTRAEARGALSFIHGRFFASNTVYDSFAVVDTHGFGHIRVYDENREVGRTDAKGQLLLPDLRAFQTNQLAIEPNDIPLDASVAFYTRQVRPQEHSGVVVSFPVHRNRAALLHLVDAHGRPLPLGSTVTLLGSGQIVTVGYDGAAYLRELALHNRVRVQMPDGRQCMVRLTYHPRADGIPTLGPLPCLEEKP